MLSRSPWATFAPLGVFLFYQLPLYSAGPYGGRYYTDSGGLGAGDGDHVEEAGVELHGQEVGELHEEEVGKKE